MNQVRDQIFTTINALIERGYTIAPGSNAAMHLSELFDQLEDNRSHCDAQRLLNLHMETVLTHGPAVGQGLALAVARIDPYTRRHGELVRRSDGKPVTPDRHNQEGTT
jgi:hypothetical protein